MHGKLEELNILTVPKVTSRSHQVNLKSQQQETYTQKKCKKKLNIHLSVFLYGLKGRESFNNEVIISGF